MATHSSILAWRITSTEEPDGLWFEQAPGVGDGQGSIWYAAVHGVAKSQTPLSD